MHKGESANGVIEEKRCNYAIIHTSTDWLAVKELNLNQRAYRKEDACGEHSSNMWSVDPAFKNKKIASC